MNRLQSAIIATLNGPDPPKTIAELSARCGTTIQYCYNQVRFLLKTGQIRPDQCPWRKTLKHKARTTDDLQLRLQEIIEENGRDRIAAIAKLSELRAADGQARWRPNNDNVQALIQSLARMIKSAGRDVLDAAIDLANLDEESDAPVTPTDPPVEAPEDSPSRME